MYNTKLAIETTTINASNGYETDGSGEVVFYRIGKVVVLRGSYTSGSAPGTSLNSKLFEIPGNCRTKAHWFNAGVESATQTILFYSDGASIFTRKQLQAKTRYVFADCYQTY